MSLLNKKNYIFNKDKSKIGSVPNLSTGRQVARQITNNKDFYQDHVCWVRW